MLKNYLIISFRYLKRHKGYSFINISGLAIGMSCAILILLWVQDELSFDSFNRNAHNIYRVVENQHYAGDKLVPVAVTPGPLAQSLKDNYPEIINSTRYDKEHVTIRYKNKMFDENVAFVDSSFFDMFTYPVSKGEPYNELNRFNCIVMTSDVAKKYFGDEDPIGKTLTVNDSLDFDVTGIMNETPTNSHLHFDLILPFEILEKLGRDLKTWGNNSYYTYVQLQSKIDVSEVEKKIKDVVKVYNEGSTTDLYLQPLLKIHLYSSGKFVSDIGGLGNVAYVNIFFLIAFIVLFIACMNFMNLSTARAAERAKEVGMRKVIGAGRWQIVRQFYTESVLFALISLVFALLISAAMLHSFNNLSGKEISFISLGSKTLIGFVILTLFTGLLAGSYPSIYLSSFLPVKVLKSDTAGLAKSSLFRKVLVVTQFSLSSILIIGTTVISNQLDYMRKENIGFDRQHVISFGIDGAIRNNLETIKIELKQDPRIISVAASDENPIFVVNSTSSLYWEGKEEKDLTLFHFMFSDQDFADTLKMEIVEGRFFSRNYSDEHTSIVINEEAAKAIGMQKPVGKSITMWGLKLKIIGVIKNFNFKSLETKIGPMVILNDKNFLRMMCARIKGDDLQETIEYIKDTYKKFSPYAPFNYHFLDDDFELLYRSENRMQAIFKYFAILAIIISCFGLFGLASQITEKRTKEIGIRKLLGANIFDLAFMLSSEFTKWILISNLIAWPVGYYVMNKWLQAYAYRVGISAWIFPLTGLLVLFVALLTVLNQTIRAATADPIKSLNYE